ncbi:LysR family transcriptional regulator [Streptomyces sp. NRRL F-5135]|uniref:LysR family transcriptional regulator n=1 Tax=Streptomyces sp. NRRL F-5135 TaxID=1463858 RepID=UPI001F37701C|nr:LysR family transcriptional regulator [Streptomyces sp. NRRL F-5135]
MLGYTQSGVSRQVAAMEAAAGAPIFDRTRRGVALTPAGQVLVRRAMEVLADVAATELELAGLRDRHHGHPRPGPTGPADGRTSRGRHRHLLARPRDRRRDPAAPFRSDTGDGDSPAEPGCLPAGTA